MLPKHHILYGLLFSGILYILFPDIGVTNLFLFFASSILIDLDHFLYYSIKKRSLNVKNAYNWFIETGKKYRSLSKKERATFPVPLCIFHGFESLLLLFLLSIFLQPAFFVLLGFVSHLFLDYIFAVYHNITFHNLSVVFKYLKLRNLSGIVGVK